MKRRITIMLIASVACALLVPGFTGRTDAADAPLPGIDSVIATQSNTSGVYRFNLYINGSTKGRAEKVNLTMFVINESGTFDGPWIDPINAIFLGNGISLRGSGPSSDTWSSWAFRLAITYPLGSDPSLIQNLFASILGLDLSEIGDLDPGDIPANATPPEDLRVMVRVRAYNSTGGYGEDVHEITDELLAAFDIPGGDVEEEKPDPDPAEKDPLPYVVLGIGAVLVIIALAFWVNRLFRGKKKGLGYSHERFY